MRSLDRFDPARGSIEGWLWRIVWPREHRPI
jgi:hypothetical protein